MEAENAPIREKAGKYDTESKAWAQERTFLAVGLNDPEAQDIARILHERIPEAERPPLDAWLKAHKADPTKAPKALQPYLQGQDTKTPSAAVPPPKAPPGAPPPPPRTETTTGAAPAASPDAIRAAYTKAVGSGRKEDWDAVDALRAQVAAETARR